MRTPLLIAASALLVSACAAGPATRSGFLTNYDSLTAVKKSGSLLQQAPRADFDPARYDSVMIDPPLVMVDDMKPADSAQLSAVFAEALGKRLGAGRSIVTRPGRNTLHVRAAITRTQKANVPINVLTSLVIAPVTKGGVAAEVEALDAASGRRIAAMSWSRRGAKITQPGLAYTRLGDARAGLRSFANKFGDLVDGDQARPKSQSAAMRSPSAER